MSDKPTRDPEEVQIEKAAVDYVFENSDGRECATDEVSPAAMKGHLRAQHIGRCIMAMNQDTLNPVTRPEGEDLTVHEVAGIELVDQYDEFNSLYVPKDIRDEAARKGDKIVWKAPDKVQRLLDQGAEVVKGKTFGRTQGSTEDGVLKANELTGVRIPQALVEKRRAQKRSRVDQQLAGSREGADKVREGAERLVYDSMIKNGIDKSKASQVSRAVGRRAEREQGDSGGGSDVERSVSITRG